MDTVKVSRKHQIAVPAAVRRRLHIRAGDVLDVTVEGDRMVLVPNHGDALERLLGVAPELWQQTDAASAVAQLRDEWTSRER